MYDSVDSRVESIRLTDMKFNLGFAVVTIESKIGDSTSAIGTFCDETFRNGDGRTFAILSSLAVVGGAILAWFV